MSSHGVNLDSGGGAGSTWISQGPDDAYGAFYSGESPQASIAVVRGGGINVTTTTLSLLRFLRPTDPTAKALAVYMAVMMSRLYVRRMGYVGPTRKQLVTGNGEATIRFTLLSQDWDPETVVYGTAPSGAGDPSMDVVCQCYDLGASGYPSSDYQESVVTRAGLFPLGPRPYYGIRGECLGISGFNFAESYGSYDCSCWYTLDQLKKSQVVILSDADPIQIVVTQRQRAANVVTLTLASAHLLRNTSGGQYQQIASVVGVDDGPWSSVTRARAANVATIKTTAPHGLRVGCTFSVSGMTASAYNVVSGIVLGVPAADKFTYSNSGADELETADTAGSARIIDYDQVPPVITALPAANQISYGSNGPDEGPTAVPAGRIELF